MNRRSLHLWKRYEPVLILVAIQALIVLLVPSRGASPSEPALPANAAVGGAAGPSVGGIAPGSVTTASGGSTAGGTSGTRGQSLTQATQAGGNAAHLAGYISSDKSKCAPGGVLQTNVIHDSPACVGRWVGDNGGATARGVTKDSVTVVYVRTPVPSFLEPAFVKAGLGSTQQQEQQALDVWGAFFNKHYEFYGRHLKFILEVDPCSTSNPPDPVGCERDNARNIAKQYHPFYVFRFGGSGIQEFYQQLSHEGVASIGGQVNMKAFYQQNRPYHYEIFPDGEKTAANIADYWCQKMANKKATLAGSPVIQAEPRKMGIVADQSFPQFDYVANDLGALITGGQCGTKGNAPVIVKTSGDPTQMSQEMTGIAQTFKSNNVTTVVCLCTALTPVQMTNAFDDQQYFPEHLLSGTGAVDEDAIAQLYSPSQWKNAFGPSFLAEETAQADSDAGHAWVDAGGPGGGSGYCLVCGAIFLYMQPLATQIQWAGPNLTPATLEHGTLTAPVLGGWERTGHNPTVVEWKFGPGDYTAWNDAKQVYWDPTVTSPINGKKGHYVCVQGCKRYEIATWPAGNPKQ